ncbi:MAG: RNA methyltransferase [Bacteroidota bacterium]|nr:RNA methyltransferase [Bacteroidota bacterium]
MKSENLSSKEDNLSERTPTRKEKIEKVLSQRQPDLTVVMENIHDPHNISAVLRTCDAVGIIDVHIVNTISPHLGKLGKKSSASAKKWVNTIYHNGISECYDSLKKQGYNIYATHLSQNSSTLYDLNLVQPVALVFGNEHSGVSEEAWQKADGNFIIPMVGMIPSLNISVACAVSLYEAFRQRIKAGKYQAPALMLQKRESLLEEWLLR